MSAVYWKERHLSALHMMGCSLTLVDLPEIRESLALVLRVRLTQQERDLLVDALLSSSDAVEAYAVLEEHLARRQVGSPLPILDEIEDSARWWADLASLPELRAWLAACFVRLPEREQAAFLENAMRRVAA